MKNPFGNYALLSAVAVTTLTSIVPGLMLNGFIDARVVTCSETETLLALGGGALAGTLAYPARLFS